MPTIWINGDGHSLDDVVNTFSQAFNLDAEGRKDIREHLTRTFNVQTNEAESRRPTEENLKKQGLENDR